MDQESSSTNLPYAEENIRGKKVQESATSEQKPLLITSEEALRFSTIQERAAELSIEYKPELFIYNPEQTIAHMLEYIQAGRNVRNFCHRLSQQERRPVLEVNNARTAAMLQNGFEHWLANFPDKETANVFVAELEAAPAYQTLLNDLKQRIQDLRSYIEKDFRVAFGWTPDTYLALSDPTADIRFELSCRPSPKAAFMKEKHGVHNRQQRDAVVDTLDTHIRGIYKVKDQLRALIFQQAKSWLDTEQIPSFVYPINHLKFSGSGITRHEAMQGDAKLAETIALPETILVFADVHQNYLPNREQPRGGNLRQFLKSSSYSNSHLIESLRSGAVIHESLEFPFSENALHKSTETIKRLLRLSKDTQLKAFDLQVVFPLQPAFDPQATIEEIWQKNRKSTAKIINQSNVERALFEPDEIMDEATTRDDKKAGLAEARRLVDDLRNTPAWLPEFRTRIPLEPNYSYAGPELA